MADQGEMLGTREGIAGDRQGHPIASHPPAVDSRSRVLNIGIADGTTRLAHKCAARSKLTVFRDDYRLFDRAMSAIELNVPSRGTEVKSDVVATPGTGEFFPTDPAAGLSVPGPHRSIGNCGRFRWRRPILSIHGCRADIGTLVVGTIAEERHQGKQHEGSDSHEIQDRSLCTKAQESHPPSPPSRP
jgi:hypothetical protein